MTTPTGPVDADFVQVDVSDEIVLAVALETQIWSQGIRVTRLDPDLQSPPTPGGRQYRLLVHCRDLPLVLEILQELQD